jgi:hypothetical protein
MSIEQWRNDDYHGKTEETRRRTCSTATSYRLRISHQVTRDWNRGFAFRSQQKCHGPLCLLCRLTPIIATFNTSVRLCWKWYFCKPRDISLRVANLIVLVTRVKNVKQKTRGCESRDREEQRGRWIWKVIRKRGGWERAACQGPTRTRQGVDPKACNSLL